MRGNLVTHEAGWRYAELDVLRPVTALRSRLRPVRSPRCQTALRAC